MSFAMVANMVINPKGSVLQSEEEDHSEKSNMKEKHRDDLSISFEELAAAGQLDEDRSLRFFGIFTTFLLLTVLLGFWILVFWSFNFMMK